MSKTLTDALKNAQKANQALADALKSEGQNLPRLGGFDWQSLLAGLLQALLPILGGILKPPPPTA